MKLLTFAIYDAKVDAHSGQWTAINAATAGRIFQDLVMDEKSDFAKHPGDFSLMETGTWDQVTAISIDISPHIDHGTARMHRSRYLLEQDYMQNDLQTAPAHTIAELKKQFSDQNRPPEDGRQTDNSRKNNDMIYGKAETITEREALRATRKESS